MKRSNWNSAGREGLEWPSRATNRPRTSAATPKMSEKIAPPEPWSRRGLPTPTIWRRIRPKLNAAV